MAKEADNNFSTAANWSGDAVPVDGDVIVFPTSVDSDRTPSDDRELTNDIVDLSVAGIQVTGDYPDGDYDSYSISGNNLTITGDILGNDATDSFPYILLDLDLTATAPVTIQSVLSEGSLSIGSNAVTLMDSDFTGGLSGSGALTIDGLGTGGGMGGGCSSTAWSNPFSGDSSGYSGAVTIESDGSLRITKETDDLGNNASGITKTADGFLVFDLDNGQDMTFDTPTTFNGGDVGVVQEPDDDCVDGATKTLTISGNVTLTADTTFDLNNANLVFTGTVTGQSYIKLDNSSDGTITLPDDSTLEAEPYTTEYDDESPSTSIYVDNNETAIVTGTYGGATVGEGGTLKGTGTVDSIYVNEGGTLAPGLSPGCINSGDLTFVEGSTYEFEVGGTEACEEYDQTQVEGTVDLGDGTLDTVLVNDFKPGKDQSYTLIDNDEDDEVTGTFKDLDEGATFEVDGYVLKISYVGGDGNDVVLTVQTVPGTPDTGFKLLLNNPLQTLLGTSLLAGLMLVLAKRYQQVTVKSRR